MVPVEVQGASTSTPSKPPLSSSGHSAASATTTSAVRPSRARLSRSRAMPRRRAVDRGDVGAGVRELRGLAAGRGAEIDDGLAVDVAEQPRRQRGGGVLHPPLALGEAGQHASPIRAASVRTLPVGNTSPCSRVAHCGRVALSR